MLGDATSALSFIASFMRSFAGKNVSSGNTPSLSMPGSCTSGISRSSVTARPPSHSRATSADSRMYAGDCASFPAPASDSNPATVASTASRSAVASTRTASGGGSIADKMLSSSPAGDPGV